MKIKVYSMDNKEKGSIDLPIQFQEVLREDLIKLGVLAIHANSRQAYGSNPDAGMRHSSKLSRRRRDYKGSYGKGISRVPRKIHSGRGAQFYWVGATAPGTVGGRRAHAPKVEKIWSKKLNDKERKKAICSALSAVMNKDLVQLRGHKVPQNYPFCVEDAFESVVKTRDAVLALNNLGFADELVRCSAKKIRAGKGKARARPYKMKKGPLVVVSQECAALKAVRTIPGVDIVCVQDINLNLLAPGTHAGRLCLFSEGSIKYLSESHQFTQDYKKVAQ